MLSEIRNDTVENVERKQVTGKDILIEGAGGDDLKHGDSPAVQARTDAEREESEGEVSEEEPEEENDDDIPYNPKNLPLGWDGKPIPYWLYKVGARVFLDIRSDH